MSVVIGADGVVRCWWCGDDPTYVAYHDDEWGQPLRDERSLFELLCLEAFQAGLSWITILRKRGAFREGFERFEPSAVAEYGAADIHRLLGDAGIVRHRGKIEATIANARATLEVQEREGSLAALLWSYEPSPGPAPRSLAELPATTPESTALSRDLRRRSFRFVGPTTAYAAMQSLGLVDDHLADCYVRPAVEAEREALPRP